MPKVPNPPKSHRQALQDLIALSGSVERLSIMLGNVPTNTIYSWCRHGQISAVGALLVAHSTELSGYFSREALRSDVDNWETIESTTLYQMYRTIQIENEKTGIPPSPMSELQAVVDRRSK